MLMCLHLRHRLWRPRYFRLHKNRWNQPEEKLCNTREGTNTLKVSVLWIMRAAYKMHQQHWFTGPNINTDCFWPHLNWPANCPGLSTLISKICLGSSCSRNQSDTSIFWLDSSSFSLQIHEPSWDFLKLLAFCHGTVISQTLLLINIIYEVYLKIKIVHPHSEPI